MSSGFLCCLNRNILTLNTGLRIYFVQLLQRKIGTQSLQQCLTFYITVDDSECRVKVLQSIEQLVTKVVKIFNSERTIVM